MARRRFHGGFTIIDLLLVVMLIGILSALARPQFNAVVIRARRSEAIAGLSHLWTSEKAYAQAHDQKYSGSFAELDFKVEGGTMLSTTSYQGKRYVYTLSQPKGATSWYCLATANLDQDVWPDVVLMHDDEH